jgi:DNA-binding NarL/FixJ family response regulator
VITNTQALQNQAQEFLEGLVKNGNSVFLLDRTPSLQKAKKYLAYGIKGYGNALMHKELFLSALGVIKQGMIWFHPELLTQLLYEQTTPTDVEQSKLEPLSKREKEVALLIKDGCTYKQMADRLNVKPRTIKAHAQSIYTKLQVKDKLDLVLYLKG